MGTIEGGNISNEIVPRFVLVFEGLIGLLPAKAARRETVARKLGQWKRVVNYYEPNEPIAHRIWDLTWRWNKQIEAVTWMPAAAVEPIKEWIDAQDLPISGVFASSPVLLSRSIPFRPDLAAIFDPDPSHRFTYGGKGRIVLDPATTDMLGSA